MGAHQVGQPLMRERQRHGDPLPGDATPSFRQVPERQQQPVVDPLYMFGLYDAPAIYRLTYQPPYGFRVEWEVGVAPDTAAFPQAAQVEALLYAAAPPWGYRAALKRLYLLYPDLWTKRARDGSWYLDEGGLTSIANPEDFATRWRPYIVRAVIAYVENPENEAYLEEIQEAYAAIRGGSGAVPPPRSRRTPARSAAQARPWF